MQTSKEWKSYGEALSKVAALSNLFSESPTPFIHYRATEYLYCRAFGAENLSRSDVAIDARKDNIGIGIKTFVYNNKPKYEKIAEFNRALSTYSSNDALEKVKIIAGLRNERIELVERTFDIRTTIYHCIARTPGKLIIFEDSMPKIQTENIALTNSDNSLVRFTDGVHKYAFNVSKSTLFKEFYAQAPSFIQEVKIHTDPFSLIDSMNIEGLPAPAEQPANVLNKIVLPLYSTQQGPSYGEVPERSGLNQWNADGRARQNKEVYIPIPAWIHRVFPGFLPPRDTPFNIILPDRRVLNVKVCQAGGKALMSNPNTDLGVWLIDHVLKLPEGQIVTRALLDDIGIDSVEITNIDEHFYLDFKKTGTFEDFQSTFNAG